MGDNGNPKDFHSVTIELADAVLKIEGQRLQTPGPGLLRISARRAGQPNSRPLEISEDDLINLLQKAIRAGILSDEFLQNLRSEFEI